jgi:hypothetical protein
MTVEQVLTLVRQQKPAQRYTRSKDGNAIGGWDAAQGRFVQVVGRLVTGECCCLSYEPLINGKPGYGPDDWMED